MCSIIVKEKGVEAGPSLYKAILSIGKYHSHGMGYCYKREGSKTVVLNKGYSNPLLVACKIFTHEFKKNDELIIHARTATHGEKSTNMCHPFVVSDDKDLIKSPEAVLLKDPVMAHNGMFFNFSKLGSPYSDTYHFIEEFLGNKQICKEFREDPELFMIKYKTTVNGKLAFLFPERDLFIHGVGWVTDWGGLKFSNNSYQHEGEYLSIEIARKLNAYKQMKTKGELEKTKFSMNPVKEALNFLTIPKKEETPMVVKTKKENKQKLDKRVFSMKLPKNYLEEVKRIKEERVKKKEAAKKYRDEQKKLTSGKNSNQHSTNGTQNGGTNSRIGKSSHQEDTLTTYKFAEESVNRIQRIINGGVNGLCSQSFRRAVNSLGYNYLQKWLDRTIEAYIDLDKDNCERFLFCGVRNKGYVHSGKIYEIRYSDNRDINRFTLVDFRQNGTTMIPVSLDEIECSGTIIPKPQFEYIYEDAYHLFESVTVTSKNFLKKLNKLLAKAVNNNKTGIFVKRFNRSYSIYAIEEFFKYNKDIYNVDNQMHMFYYMIPKLEEKKPQMQD